MKISEAQALIAKAYGDKDRKRGTPGTFMYLVEEVGELSTALREEGREERASEMADVFAWTLSLAELEGIDLEKEFLKKYRVCSGCGKSICACLTKP